ncbi:radical SAM protein [Candidatus Gracilibacteria bacterium]|nr:radical SAM protein [Candidatus Gracilibacteria bacterium]
MLPKWLPIPEGTKSIVAGFDEIAAKDGLLPIKVSDFYAKKVEEEIRVLKERGLASIGPLYRCVLPGEDRFVARVSGEVGDFIGDKVNMPEELRDVLIWKYRDRVLFLPTDTCAANCQYCFRTAYLSDRYGAKPFTLKEKVMKLVEFLRAHPEIEEVILSGGDPMVLAPRDLEMILRALREDAHIKHIRIHSRTLVYSPFVYTQAACEMLAKYRVRLVHHATHPYEICDTVKEHVQRLSRAGVHQYNQFPLLRNINDHVDVLRELIVALDEIGIRTISIFAPDVVNFSAPFRISLKRQFALMDELAWSSPAWVHAVRYALDNPHGKVRKEDFIRFEQETGSDGKITPFAIFKREGREIRYPDFPEKLDIPGNVQTMLWKR